MEDFDFEILKDSNWMSEWSNHLDFSIDDFKTAIVDTCHFFDIPSDVFSHSLAANDFSDCGVVGDLVDSNVFKELENIDGLFPLQVLATHAIAEQALLSLPDPPSYSEEISERYCDFMAGVRASVAGFTIDNLESCIDQDDNLSGERFDAFREGVKFAEAYKSENDGDQPTLIECVKAMEDTSFYKENCVPFNPVVHAGPSFGRLADTVDDGEILPHYDHEGSSSLLERVRNPFGIYAIRNLYGFGGLPEPELQTRVVLPENFSQNDLQRACDLMCDCVHWDHLPVRITTSVGNAQWSSGPFLHKTFDDLLSLNPDYAKACIEHCGSTDIVLSDMAHEIGHSIAYNICGDMDTYMNEKVADFISGFINGKMSVDIDVARKWFEWEYDPDGKGGYPISEERWDAEAAGYYFSTLANGEDLQEVLKDPKFLEIIELYSQDKIEMMNQSLWHSTDQEPCIEQSPNFVKMLEKQIFDQLHKSGPLMCYLLKRIHLHI